MITRNLLLGVSLGSCLAVATAATADTPRKQIYQKTLRSTALVLAGDGSGTGWLIDTQRRLLVTNHHVVGKNETVTILFPQYKNGKLVAEREFYKNQQNARRYRGSVLDTDPKRDLALIEVEALPADVTHLPLAAESASPGDTLHSVGNPGVSDALWIYTGGLVRSVYQKTIRFSDQTIEARVIETSSPINPGDSGGPVLNDGGELVGVVSCLNRTAQGVSYCIDINEVREFLAETQKLLKPETAEDFSRRGEHFSSKGKNDRAIADFTQALHLDPKLTAAYRNRAAAFRNKGDYITALADYAEAIKLDPRFPDAYRDRGWVYLRKGDNDRAIEDTTQAIRLNPQDAIAYNLRGLAYDNKQQPDQAIRDFSQAITLKPDFAIAYYNRGDMYRTRNDLDAALADFAESVRLYPFNAVVYRERGQVYQLKQSYAEAIADYTKALELNPTLPGTHRFRATTYKLMEKYDLSVADCTEAIKVNPKDSFAWNMRGAAHSFLDKWDEAIADYTQALKLNPKFAVVWKNRGLAHQVKGNKAQAEKDLNEAYRLDPSLKPQEAAKKKG